MSAQEKEERLKKLIEASKIRHSPKKKKEIKKRDKRRKFKKVENEKVLLIEKPKIIIRQKEFVRPQAIYTNTSPFGIAQEMLMEQLREEKMNKINGRSQ